ncbi:MAG TPA: biopolymer transporter ExbD [Lysobacter sp.]|jgi:biopolymer transport protein ExbD|nr:biopolymer transporter ExbD [Lysobacter sp.]
MSLNPFRGARRKHEEPQLNLIPMIDIMSVMVAFLLIYSTEVEVVPNAGNVQIPVSTAEVKPAETVVVTITKDMLLVQGERIATMDQIRDPKAALIEPLREYLSRPLSTKSGAAQQAALAHREITVLADRSLPYEVIRKVMTTCTAAAYDKLSLAVLENGGSAPTGG